MTTTSMIPSLDWSKGASDAFTDAAGLGTPVAQILLCVHCVRNGNYAPPSSIVLCEGNSVCAEHM